jgi:hypothetical protein
MNEHQLYWERKSVQTQKKIRIFLETIFSHFVVFPVSLLLLLNQKKEKRKKKKVQKLKKLKKLFSVKPFLFRLPEHFI